jgi:hypothetical protein
MNKVKLPKDGAAYHCTYPVGFERCGKPTIIGIPMEDYDRFRVAGYVGMRAVCGHHFNKLSEGVLGE